jgi:large conductance mechanosensitive channel
MAQLSPSNLVFLPNQNTITKNKLKIFKKLSMKGFITFIREQGVVGLAVGFILGGAISKLVSAVVGDVINPLLGLALGAVGNFEDAAITIGSAKFLWGNLVNTIIDFLVITAVVYFGVKATGLDKLDKPKS